MAEQSNREIIDTMFAEINHEIELAKAGGATQKLQELYLKKAELIEWMKNTLEDEIIKKLRRN